MPAQSRSQLRTAAQGWPPLPVPWTMTEAMSSTSASALSPVPLGSRQRGCHQDGATGSAGVGIAERRDHRIPALKEPLELTVLVGARDDDRVAESRCVGWTANTGFSIASAMRASKHMQRAGLSLA